MYSGGFQAQVEKDQLEQIRLGLSAYDEKLKEMGASL